MVALQEVQARGLKFGLSDSELPFSTNCPVRFLGRQWKPGTYIELLLASPTGQTHQADDIRQPYQCLEILGKIIIRFCRLTHIQNTYRLLGGVLKPAFRVLYTGSGLGGVTIHPK